MKSISGDLIAPRLARLRQEKTAVAVNRLLYECLRDAIHDGSLPAGTRLPPTRDLAAEAGISRNTVMHAYEQLIAEGYTRGLTGSGTYVAERIPDLPPLKPGNPAVAPAGKSVAGRLSRRGRKVVMGAQAQATQWGAFLPGVPDVTQVPHAKLAQITARLSRELPPSTLSYATNGGYARLHQSLAVYLRQARSVVCEPGQIVVTEGVHQAIDLITRVLGDAGDHAWVEEPGYWGTRSILEINGIRLKPMPVDAEGMRFPIQATARPPRFAFVTPSHQYPLGPVMSLSRRLDLLNFAAQHGTWVVEDDYDSEFRFSGHPVASLQGLLPGAPVIYVGTFSKTLYPGLRMAYMVVPAPFAAAFRTAQSKLYRGGHMLQQAALAEFMDSGQYAAHIRRMRLIYAARRAYLIQLVEQSLGPGWVHEYDSNAGLHLVLALPPGTDDVAIAAEAAARGVIARPLSIYYFGRNPSPGLILAFASVPQEEMLAPWQVVARCILEAVAKKR
ncbi:PLP-dependent aminotransferase family protein [Comamonas endophytica]|uniref:PLP-dependent aminotransferase family protein n=1 Tax=Comamonas endophytica TaxID=2949090 RepID=A0ABY6G859_9BURK|nr:MULTISPECIES: PLP-dependent aminotransferase family protein [unclassified Acidovorax]MCD2514503.1 PLP-dependent aminotransferase family protein [Acidovorax sp. D4N7]UYG51083.1 PLP-dependent aminotransferase family protein [Acidovorax sp. 5MLIR]